jgi:uncharacterized protein (DUF58 family)
MSRQTQITRRHVRTRLTVAGRYWLLVSIGLAVVGIYKNINLILLMAYALIALLVLNWWKARQALTKILATWDPIPDGFAGEPKTIRCVVSNEGRFATSGIQVFVTTGDQTISWYLERLKSKDSVNLNHNICFPTRGVFPNGELLLKNSFPFGLVASTVRQSDSRMFACYPRRGRIELAPLLRLLTSDAISLGSHRTAVRQLTDGTDIHGLRPFRAGDSPRWIHWRTTARVGERMVREFDRASGPRLSVILLPTDGKLPAGESALELAATIVWEWSRRQDSQLVLWLPISARWENMTLDHRRQADQMMRDLAAISVTELYCNDPVPTSPSLKSHSRFVYIKKGDGSSPCQLRGSNSVFVDPTIVSEVYHPPVVEL